MNSIAERLKLERERLGMNQSDFGAVAGVKRNAQMNYENGTRSPTADYLLAISGAGADVGYIITGDRGSLGSQFERELANLSDAWEALDEALLKAKKMMPPDKKRLAAEALYQAVKEGEGQAEPLAKLLIKAA